MSGKVPGPRFCRVISVSDDKGMDKIQVEISPNDIISAFPLLPKVFHVKPKVGEGVFIFFTDASDERSQAYYLGPVISQEHKLGFDAYQFNPAMRGSFIAPDVNPLTLDKDYVAFIPPKDDEIAVRSRKSSEVRLTDDDVRMMAGVRRMSKAPTTLESATSKNQYGIVFNQKNPVFAKFKYHYSPLVGNTQSTATIVAEKINLLSTNSTENNVDFNIDPNDLIKDEDLNKIIESAYRLPYGEKLVELLKLIINALITHTHPYIMMPPTVGNTDLERLKAEKATLLDNEKLLSDTVRFN